METIISNVRLKKLKASRAQIPLLEKLPSYHQWEYKLNEVGVRMHVHEKLEKGPDANERLYKNW